MLLGEPVFAAQDALYFKPFLQVIAREDELGSFTSGEDAVVVGGFDATKFREVATFREVFGDTVDEKPGCRCGIRASISRVNSSSPGS